MLCHHPFGRYGPVFTWPSLKTETVVSVLQ